MTIAELVEKYIQCRDKKAEYKAEYDLKVAKVEEAMDKIENKFLEVFASTGMESIRTEFGTAFASSRTSCTVADNCAETGQKCDESTGKCIDITVYCKEDADCDGDLVCNTDTGQCIDKTQDCTTGIECGEGFICNEDTGDCILVTHDCNEEGCPENQTCNISTGRCEKIKGTSYLWVLYITIPILILLIWFLIRELNK
jgi:hypothetical protein